MCRERRSTAIHIQVVQVEDVALCDLVRSWSEQLEDVIPFSVLLCVSSYTRHTSGCVPVKSGH